MSLKEAQNQQTHKMSSKYNTYILCFLRPTNYDPIIILLPNQLGGLNPISLLPLNQQS